MADHRLGLGNCAARSCSSAAPISAARRTASHTLACAHSLSRRVGGGDPGRAGWFISLSLTS